VANKNLDSNTIKVSKFWNLLKSIIKGEVETSNSKTSLSKWPKWSFNYNNYQKMSDGLGLGLGVNSSFESWVDTLNG
jgi:hypothetical protein